MNHSDNETQVPSSAETGSSMTPTPDPSSVQSTRSQSSSAPHSSTSGQDDNLLMGLVGMILSIGKRDNLVTIVLALVLALGIRTFVAEARWIPSESMIPTLEIGDRLVVEKVSYHFTEPRRGDIVVFQPPAELDFRGAYIKRIVGIPGDRMRIQDGVVFVNDVPLDEPYTAAPPTYDCPGSGCFLGPDTDMTDFVVPEDSYFVMGDNRNDSQDSHVWGFLPRQNIIGHTFVRFWPLGRLHHFGQVNYPSLDGSL